MPDPSTLGMAVADSTMKAPGSGVTESSYRQISANDGAQSFALQIATVMQVDYEKHEVTLRTENGETFEHSPVSLTYPGAGARHFLGAMPLAGDLAIVGWGSGESGRTRRPYVLGWLPAGTAGHDWWVMQPFAQDEHNLTPKDRAKFEGIANRTRYKLRHMLPGNIVGSSAQGSDLVLDEGVLLANRRGNEIRLRDQDQAFIVRSLQQFHAGAGFRVYSGLVQRDATFLPTSMFSDGTYWDAPAQLDAEGNPIGESDLGESPVATGYLSPNKVFQRDGSGNRISTFTNGDGQAVSPFPGNVDPYVFLQKVLLVDAAGRATSEPSDAVYGGKAMYRVSTDGTNAVTDPQTDALTEFRIEVSHVSDGTLPVTEQTDGFDADRMPDSMPRLGSPLNDSIYAPFAEFVIGSVVGNDPFSLVGRPLYGVPIRPVVFNGEQRSPALATGLGVPLTEHAATLLRVSPPMDRTAQPTFWSVLKDGRVRMSVAGPGTAYSAEAAFGAGLRIGAGRTPDGQGVRMDAEGRILLHNVRGDNLTNRGVEILSDSGAVRLYAGGSETVGGIAQRASPTAGGETTLPGLTLESATNTLIKASGAVVLMANQLELRDITRLLLSGNSAVNIQSGDTISQTSKVRDTTSMGKSTETYSGPKDNLPSNGPVREVTIATTPATGFTGGTADKYGLVYGDREETIDAGNHSTTVTVGDMTYRASAGTWKAQAATNEVSLSVSGLSASVLTGGMTFSASAGSALISAAMGVVVKSTGSTVVVQGTSVILSATGGKTGGIVSGADLDPVSGLALSVLGMGSSSQLLAAV